MEFVFKIDDLEATKDLAFKLSHFLTSIDSEQAQVLALTGELGAGKTTFIQFLSSCFGVDDIVVSPTFVICRRYQLSGGKFDQLLHFDSYRLDSSEELLSLGWSEIVSDRSNLICVEWADKVLDILPADTHWIEFSLDADSRQVTFRSKSDREEIFYNGQK